MSEDKNNSSNNKNELSEDSFKEAFDELLKEENQDIVSINPENNNLQSELFGAEESKVLNESDLEKAMGEYIPPSVDDSDWEEFVSREPLPSLNREQESRAIMLGLEEIRKTKHYMHKMYRHMTSEFRRSYKTFEMLFENYFDEQFSKTHKDIESAMEDMEHLIAGDIDRMKAVQEDFKTYQKFEEKRLSILHDILEYYNNKKKQ